MDKHFDSVPIKVSELAELRRDLRTAQERVRELEDMTLEPPITQDIAERLRKCNEERKLADRAEVAPAVTRPEMAGPTAEWLAGEYMPLPSNDRVNVMAVISWLKGDEIGKLPRPSRGQAALALENLLAVPSLVEANQPSRERAEAALAEAQQSSAEPDGEVVAGTGSLNDLCVIKWISSYRPKEGDKIYAAPPSLAAAVSAAVEKCAHTASVFGASGIVTSAIRGLAPAISAETEAMQEDAERYRWLLKNARRIDIAGISITGMSQLSGRIDTARGKK